MAECKAAEKENLKLNLAEDNKKENNNIQAEASKGKDKNNFKGNKAEDINISKADKELVRQHKKAKKEKKEEKENLKRLFEKEGTNADASGQKKLSRRERRQFVFSTGLYLSYRAINAEAVRGILSSYVFNAPMGDVYHLIEEREKNGRHFKAKAPKEKKIRKKQPDGSYAEQVSYVQQHTPISICAHQISFMLPRDFNTDYLSDLVSEFLTKFDSRCRHLVYGYRAYTCKGISWAEVLIFTHPVLKEPLKETKRWTSDYYWSSSLKRRASAKEYSQDKTGTITLRHKAGQPMLDENGNVQTETIYVSSRDVRMFRYNPGKKRGHELTGFEVLMERLKGALLLALCSYDDTLDSRRTFISKMPYRKGHYKKSTMIKVRDRNRLIDLVNRNLARIQASIDAAGLEDCDDVRELWQTFRHQLADLCHADSFKLAGHTYLMNYRGYFSEFHERLSALLSLLEKKFHLFYVKYAELMLKYGLGSKEQLLMAQRDRDELNPNRRRKSYEEIMAEQPVEITTVSDLKAFPPSKSTVNWDEIISNLYAD